MEKTKRKTFEAHWEEIERNFDFGRVHSVMVFLNWKWRGAHLERYIPSVQRLKESARERCLNAYESKWGNSSSGGFKATYDRKYDMMLLAFIVEDWDTSEY